MRVFAFTGASAIALSFCTAAVAQNDPQSEPAASQANQHEYELQEIIVTAQRREESAQSVPIAVAAFSGDQMTKVGLSSSADLASVIPGIAINPSAARSPIFLRGVGNNTYSTSPSVLTFVDGVYQPFDVSGADYSNVQSIELAKGPQGTLFGRNATGGVIQITTKNPHDWQGLDVQLGYANYDTYSAKLYGSAKLSDAVAIGIAGFYENQTDGWGVNRGIGGDIYDTKRYGVRGKLVAELDDTFTATLTGDYSDRRGSVGLGVSPSTTSGILYNPITDTAFTLPSKYDILSDISPFYHVKEHGAALTLDKEFGGVKLLSISSYRGDTETFRIDSDGIDVSLFNVFRDDKRSSFTQELQLSGNSGPITWVSGLYYYYMKNDIDGPRFIGGAIPSIFGNAPGVPFRHFSLDTTNAYAAYAQATAALGPSTNLTLGARYTIEKREITGHTTGSPFLSPTSAGTQKATFKKPNYRIALDHKLTPDVLVYASWSRGFNAGFFNQIATGGFNNLANPVVQPEGIDAYEVGFKSDLLDRRLRVNVAAFLYDYSNLQQQIYEFGAIKVINAASARIKGVDVDIVARPVRDLTLSFSANFLDTKYKSYPAAPNYDFFPNGAFAAVGTLDAKGNELIGAPPFGLQASATYTLRTGIGTFDTTGTVNYQRRQYADPQNEYAIPGRTLVNLTEQWTSNDEKTTVTAWVKNLTNKVYDVSNSLLAPTGLVGNPGAPRTYGVTIGRKF